MYPDGGSDAPVEGVWVEDGPVWLTGPGAERTEGRGGRVPE